MRAAGAVIMTAGVVIILNVPDLSGGTLAGALVFLLGLYVAGRAQEDREVRRVPFDSVDALVDQEAARMVPRG